MSYSEWKTVKLGEVMDINPRTVLKKGTAAKKVAMENVKEFTRKIAEYETEKFKSGSKFKNNDTLFARITPCLENGKTAFVDILDDDEVAFGSTEFFVLRNKSEISDAKYIYYLSISDEFRNTAIQSMTGTSGRQRAQKEALLEFEINFPPLHEQMKIGRTLSFFDEKIELNRTIISNLEELVQTLFKYWFVDFEFPNENGEPYKSSGGKMVESELRMIPEGWEVEKISSISKFIMGQSPKSATYNDNQEGLPLINGASDFKKDHIKPLKYTSDPKRLSKEGDFLFGVRATVGNVTYVDKEYALGRGVGVARPLENEYSEFIYFQLIQGINFLEKSVTGSVYINFTRKDLEDLKIILPKTDLIKLFHQKVNYLLNQKYNLLKENRNLSELRDTLLPKLLSGEIELPDDLEVTEDVPIS